MYSVWHKTLKIASISVATPQTTPRELATLPQAPYLVVRSFLLSTIAASRLRHLQFPILGGIDCLHHSWRIAASVEENGKKRREGDVQIREWSEMHYEGNIVGGEVNRKGKESGRIDAGEESGGRL